MPIDGLPINTSSCSSPVGRLTKQRCRIKCRVAWNAIRLPGNHFLTRTKLLVSHPPCDVTRAIALSLICSEQMTQRV